MHYGLDSNHPGNLGRLVVDPWKPRVIVKNTLEYPGTSKNIPQIEKFAECAGDLSYVKIACAAVFVSLNNSYIVSFCCLTKISRLEPRLKLKVCGRQRNWPRMQGKLSNLEHALDSRVLHSNHLTFQGKISCNPPGFLGCKTSAKSASHSYACMDLKWNSSPWCIHRHHRNDLPLV